MDHADRVSEAKDALYRVEGDTSVPASTTRESLEELIEVIRTMLEALE